MYLESFNSYVLITVKDRPTPLSPSLVLGGPSDKSPVNTDRLTHHVLSIEPLHGCLGFFVGLILHQSISLEAVGRTACELFMASLLWNMVAFHNSSVQYSITLGAD